MKFSIIITTRERPDYLTGLIKSINDLTNDKSNIEIHINTDNDDQLTNRLDRIFTKDYPQLTIYFHTRERSMYMHRDYLNWCIRNFSVTGEFLIYLNDDVIFLNKDWDKLAYDKLQEYLLDKPDGVVYAKTEDHEKAKNYGGGHYSCFPIISKKAVDAMGFFFDDEYIAWNADIGMYQVFDKIGRILDLRGEVDLCHLSVHSGRRPVDNVNKDFKKIHKLNPGPDNFLGRDSTLLLDYIEKVRKERGL